MTMPTKEAALKVLRSACSESLESGNAGDWQTARKVLEVALATGGK